MKRSRTYVMTASVIVAATAAWGGTALLGAGDFKASAESPMGWRGDGTGRYPGANPPVNWSRTAESATFDAIRCQAKKPADGEGASGKQLARSLSFRSFSEWLVAGPLTAPDSSKPLEGDIVPGEADLSPNDGDKVGNSQWKTTDLPGGDLVAAIGKMEKGQVALAHTYFFSPDGGKLLLRMGGGEGCGVKVLINGKKLEGEWITPQKGWNRVLVKATPSDKQKCTIWSSFVPQDVTYKDKNIIWATPMPAYSYSTPVIAGDKIFTTSDSTDLLCLDKNSGKILWIRSTTFLDAAMNEMGDRQPEFRMVSRGRASVTMAASKTLKRDTAVKTASYTISSGKLTKAELSPNGATVRLTVAEPWKEGETVSVEFPGVRSEDDKPALGKVTFSIVPGLATDGQLLRECLVGEVKKDADLSKIVNEGFIDEKAAAPAAGDKWKVARSEDGNFDLAAITGGGQNVGVYAGVYLNSTEDRKVQVWVGSDDGIRVVVNGEAVHKNPASRGCSPDQDKIQGVSLKKGWNKVLFMISQGGGGWGFTARVMDEAGKGAAPGVGYSADDPAKVDSEKPDGPLADESPGYAYMKDGAPLAQRLVELNDLYAKEPKKETLDEMHKIVGKLSEMVRKDPKYKFPGGWGWGGGSSAPTPVTDGEFIYVWYGDAGLLSCFDLNGKRIWTRYEPIGGAHHGTNASAILIGNRLIVFGHIWVAYDKKTGRELWRQTAIRGNSYASPVLARVGGKPIIVAPFGSLINPEDGNVLSAKSMSDGENASPIVRDKEFFLISRGGFHAVKLPETLDGDTNVQPYWSWKDDREIYPTGSPVYHDGLVYFLHSPQNATLYVADPAAKQIVLIQRPIDMPLRILYGADGGGIVPSLTVAGKYLYMMGNQGVTWVLEPGRTLKVVAKNEISQLYGWFYGQEVTQASPVFEGNRLYVRGVVNFYCIGDK